MSASAPTGPNQLRVALCQMPVTASKEDNLATARDYLQRAHDAGASLAVLPECFNSPYDTSCFRRYAETLPGAPSSGADADAGAEESPSLRMLRAAARDTGLHIIAGSIPEIDGERVYNTSLSLAPDGRILAKHRKAHLFDVDVPNGIKFTESSVLTAGACATAFETDPLVPSASGGSEERERLTVGVSICYDVRFAELALLQTQHLRARLLVVPGAFNLTTGPAHWELLMRARALDNQVFVAACSPARATAGDGYKAWGHSLVVDPWGTVLQQADEKECLLVVDVDLAKVDSVRQSIPLYKQRRPDIYTLEHHNAS